MLFRKLFLAASVTAGAAAYQCHTDGKGGRDFQITTDKAVEAMNAGGSNTSTKSGFPHTFGGNTGGGGAGSRITFPGATDACNAETRALLEFPVFSGNRIYDKDSKRGGEGTPTPARVIYLYNDPELTLCGVITHIVEDMDGRGSGNFALC